jgi:uncharacterized caspase-like protein
LKVIMKKKSVLQLLKFAFMLALSCALPANAQRIALLIGNAQYAVKPLENPANDVREMEQALLAVGFKVQTAYNLDRRSFSRALSDFGEQAAGAEVAFFYYSGHGTQAKGENYLIPVDAAIRREADYDGEAIQANAILSQINNARPKAAVVVLDACRDNPFASNTKSTTKGLARMDTPIGTLLAFATAPNATASDDGHYARSLAKHLRTPGLELTDVFRNTNAEISERTGGTQIARIDLSLNQRVYLAGHHAGGNAAGNGISASDSSAAAAALQLERQKLADAQKAALQDRQKANEALLKAQELQLQVAIDNVNRQREQDAADRQKHVQQREQEAAERARSQNNNSSNYNNVNTANGNSNGGRSRAEIERLRNYIDNFKGCITVTFGQACGNAAKAELCRRHDVC